MGYLFITWDLIKQDFADMVIPITVAVVLFFFVLDKYRTWHRQQG